MSDFASGMNHHRGDARTPGIDMELWNAITAPTRLWTPSEMRARTCPVPASAGIYAWYFDEPPADFDTTECIHKDGWALLYIGIAPGRAGSKSNLRRRLRQHYRDRGSSTLRRTLAGLLAERLDLVPGSSTHGRLGIGDEGEKRLSDWISDHASVTWAEIADPWLVEQELVRRLNLPLNLMHNKSHVFAKDLATVRAGARELVRLAAERGKDRVQASARPSEG